MPAPVSFGYCEDNSKIFTPLTWIDGQDAHKVLPRLSFTEQYNLGMQAGRILRKLHDNSLTEYNEDWQARYLSVIEPRLAAYKNEGVQFEGSSQVLEYLETNKALLSDRPQVFHHGDFHLGNMVINNGRLSIIDWDTADFDNIGDPWYEFNRIGVEEPAFVAGQIDGYFGVNIPERFWRLFAYYQAGSAITSIVWAKYFAPQCLNEIMNLNKDIVHWYGGMQNTIPTWYVNIRAKVREQ